LGMGRLRTMADILGRTGPNTFLDQVELEERERKSAAIEGREPDFSIPNIAPLLATPSVVVEAEDEITEELNFD